MNRVGARSGKVFSDYYRSLSEEFTTTEALKKAEDFEIAEATVHVWLRRLKQEGYIIRVRHGVYLKIFNEIKYKPINNQKVGEENV